MLITDDDPGRPWEAEGVFAVSPGVYRVPLPMPNDALRAVNVYVIEDDGGLTLIDAGVAIADSRRRLESAMTALDRNLGDIDRFLVTHIHYDHYSQALALREEFGTRVSLGREEEPSLKALADRSLPPLARQLALLHLYGASDVADAVIADRARNADREPVTGLPDDWLDADVDVTIGSKVLRAIHTPGHTQGHVVFLDSEADLLFAGDHVLPRITPSIGFEPVPGPLPLGDYLRSLRLVRRVPDTYLLPAHGPIVESVHDRIDELLSHHDRRLEAAARSVATGAQTGREVAKQLTWTRRERHLDELDAFNRMLAVLETGAHLDLLVDREQLSVTEIEGILHYEPM